MTQPGLTSTRDVLIQTEALETAAKFYETVLGLTVISRTDDLIGLETGAFRLFLDRGRSFGPVFEFEVPDLKLTKQRLLHAGCRIEQDDPKIPRLYVRDPFGLVFNVAQKSSKPRPKKDTVPPPPPHSGHSLSVLAPPPPKKAAKPVKVAPPPAKKAAPPAPAPTKAPAKKSAAKKKK